MTKDQAQNELVKIKQTLQALAELHQDVMSKAFAVDSTWRDAELVAYLKGLGTPAAGLLLAEIEGERLEGMDKIAYALEALVGQAYLSRMEITKYL